MSQSISTGFNFELCIKCESFDYPTGANFRWTFITPDCSTHVVSSPAKSNLILAYDEGSSLETIATGWSDGIFTNP